MRRLLAVLLVAVLTLSACGGIVDTTAPATDPTDPTVWETDPPTPKCEHSKTTVYKKPAKALAEGFEKTVCDLCGETLEETVIPATKKLKLLALGNSYSTDSTTYLYDILKAAGVEELIIANISISGCSINKHWSMAKSGEEAYTLKIYTANGSSSQKSSMKYAVTLEEWDVITIQQASQNAGTAHQWHNLDNLVNYVIDTCPNPSFELIFHMTWAYQQGFSDKPSFFTYYNGDQLTMYNAIVEMMQTVVLKQENIERLIPTGTAIQNLRSSYIGDNLNRDGTHLTMDVGRYTAALTWACYITGADPYSIDWVPDKYPNITKDLPAIREAVTNAIAKPFEITESTLKTQN